jgi:SAM-dependent methyltransferase
MTPTWMSGYVGDVTYTLGFYRELAPSYLNYVCIISGVEGIPVGRTLRYCDLGCGRGYGTTLLAAANPDIEFVGIDFNPMHVNEARAFAKRAAISNVTFLELSFGEAARSTDPPVNEFDVVALHGVFNWVAPNVRHEILEFLRAKLVPGGLAYVSYNTLPGWAAMAPVQHLLKEYADRASGDSAARIEKGRAVLKVLVDKSSAYIAQNPMVKMRLEALDKHDQHYLVHEFLPDHWQPLYVTSVLSSLAEAKLTFVGSAGVAENRLILCVPKDLMELVQSAPDLALRELLKDFAINKQFRRDVYAKGRLRLTGQDLRGRADEMAFALTVVPKELPEKWPIPSGGVIVKPQVVEAIVSRLQQGPARGAELLALGTKADISTEELPTILEILVHNGVVTPCRPDFASVDHSASRRVNQAVLDLALSGDTHRFLAAPILGSAIGASYFERVAALVLGEDQAVDDDTAAGRMLDRLEGVGRVVLRDGQPLNRKEAAKLIREFRSSSLPRWQNLGVLG